MSVDSIHIKLKINFPVILFTVLLVHALFLGSNSFPKFTELLVRPEPKKPLIIKSIEDIRTVGSRESKIKNSAYLSKSDLSSNTVAKNKAGRVSQTQNAKPSPQKHPLSLSDLSMAKAANQASEMAQAPKAQRPGLRPEVQPEKNKAISAISLKGSQIRDFMKGSAVASSAAELSGDPRVRSLNNSDILVNLEVPEGVDPDELNKYELMFYGFQRRTAINYVNAFYKNLDKFQRENPHVQFPMTETKQIMTGRLTYDEKGNIKQIKMIRWTNVDRLQNFFEDVLKDMDTLHNPPKPLWSKTGEFSIFFSLVING